MTAVEIPSVLVVSAHAADFVWRSGGTIANYTRAGSPVDVVCVTLGQRGESIRLWDEGAASEDDVIAMRRAESVGAAETLGATVEFLDAVDHPLVYDRAVIESLVTVMRRAAPHIILTHYATDVHNPDHEAVFQLTRWAMRSATVNGVLPDIPRLTFVPQILSFESDQPTLDRFTPDVYVDITATIDLKREAMAKVTSQFDEMCDRYMDRARFRASMMKNVSATYAEAFQRLHPFEGDSIPI